MFKGKKIGRSKGLATLAMIAVACGGTSLGEKTDGDAATTSLALKAGVGQSVVSALDINEAIRIDAGLACVERIKIKLPDGVQCSDVTFLDVSTVKCEDDDTTLTPSESDDNSTVAMGEDDDEGETDDSGQDSPGDMEDDSVDNSEIYINGPFLFDLIKGTSTPSLADITIPSGSYKEIEFEFDAKCSELPEDVSVQIQGNVTDSAETNHPFEIELKFKEDLEISSQSGIQVLEGETNTMIATLLVDDWFEDSKFVKCVEDDNLPKTAGVIEIDEDYTGDGACEDIYDDISEGLDDALEFEDHSDDDDDSDDDSNDDDDNSNDDNSGDDNS